MYEMYLKSLGFHHYPVKSEEESILALARPLSRKRIKVHQRESKIKRMRERFKLMDSSLLSCLMMDHLRLKNQKDKTYSDDRT